MEQQSLKQAQQDNLRQIAEARDRAEMLLKEVNHRVANSLAIVSALVQMQANVISDPAAKDMLQDTYARITAIAALHKRLYTSADVTRVEINAYCKALVEELAVTLNLGERLKFAPADTG